jgi:exopolyphosphatase/guanosine-5'-triphosphate,3'-diphosphate pyrophosphatase
MWRRHHDDVAVGVVDVGSNTVRLLVAEGDRPLLQLREALGLGAAVEEHGAIPPAKLAETAGVVARFADAARAEGAEALEILVASPGRQAANAGELIEALATASRSPVRVLSAAEEGRLAFVGALSKLRVPARKTVAVVDVGGGSAQVTIGSRRTGPLWIRSIDLGSLRLTRRCLPGDPPGREAIEAARREAARMLEGFDPPLPARGFAVGGSARAVRRVVGDDLDAERLAEAIRIAAITPADELVASWGLNPTRGRTVAGGAVLLEALQARLDVPLRVVRAGLREGALAELGNRLAAAA